MAVKQKIFVTGGAGFVGSNVVRQLVAQGRDVALLLRPTTSTRRITDVISQTTQIMGGLGDVETWKSEFCKFAPQAVLHLAWAGIKGTDRNNLCQIDNVNQSLELYKLSVATNCEKFVGLGSQAEYGPQSGLIRESMQAMPTDLYGVTKLATAQILDRVSALTGRQFAWLRLFSSYGPDDDPDWMIPYLIGRLLKRERPNLTAGEQIWDYIHVSDVARGIIMAMDSDATGIFNLGSGIGKPLREIIETIRNKIDPTLPLGFGEVAYSANQVMHLEADISALSAATRWQPVIPLEKGLAETIAWHRMQQAGPIKEL